MLKYCSNDKLDSLVSGWNPHSNTANAASGAHPDIWFPILQPKIFVLYLVPGPRVLKAGLHPGHEQCSGDQQILSDNHCSDFLLVRAVPLVTRS